MKWLARILLVALGINIWVLILLWMSWKVFFIEGIWNIINDKISYQIQYKQNRHSNNIAIIKIDERTLEAFGKSDLGMLAFDKWVYAELIKKVFEHYKASALWFDIVFANPSVLGIQDEQRLANALQKYKEKVVIASSKDYKPHPLCLYSSSKHGIINLEGQSQIRTFQNKAYPYNMSLHCPGSKVHTENSPEIYSLSRELLEIYTKSASPFEKEKITKNLEFIDAQKNQSSYIQYYSDGQKHSETWGYPSYSFIDIYKWALETPSGKAISLRNKIVLVWEMWTLIHDSHITPVHHSQKMPGVEINANIISTLQQWDFLSKAPFFLSVILLSIMQILIIISVMKLRPLLAVSIFAAWIFSLVIFCAWAFTQGNIYNTFSGILGVFLSFVIAYIYKFYVTDHAKRIMKQQFASYVSPDVVEEISENPKSVLIKWEKRDISIFFSDIVSFTSISEKSDAEDIVEMLNEYFSEMTHIIHKNKGTLDKYIGDAVMCFFNAPLLQENHSYYACKTALEQQKKLRELNTLWQKKWYPEIKIRIGLHSWEAIHGNIWKSDTRVNYTVIGDSVNLASRLEWICKKYGISICVSQDVYERQKNAFHFRELDTISVKGRSQAVKIYQLITEKSTKTPEKLTQYLERYAEALGLYRKWDFKAAQNIFSQNTWDEASHVMAQRCQDIQDWKATLNQGVFEMQTK